MMATCGLISLVTAMTWRTAGGIHRFRFQILFHALFLVFIGWPIAEWVTQLRLDKLSTDSSIAATATSLFVPVHLVSLALSLLTNLFTGIGLFFAGQLPRNDESR